jgi:hypothetical protein
MRTYKYGRSILGRDLLRIGLKELAFKIKELT